MYRKNCGNCFSLIKPEENGCEKNVIGGVKLSYLWAHKHTHESTRERKIIILSKLICKHMERSVLKIHFLGVFKIKIEHFVVCGSCTGCSSVSPALISCTSVKITAREFFPSSMEDTSTVIGTKRPQTKCRKGGIIFSTEWCIKIKSSSNPPAIKYYQKSAMSRKSKLANVTFLFHIFSDFHMLFHIARIKL